MGITTINGKGRAVLFSTLMVVTGCAVTPPQRPPEMEPSVYLADQAAPQAPATPKSNGSLWDERAPMADMFATPKAKYVGDILTVRVVESSTAQNKASTKTERTSDVNAQLSNLFNLEKWYPSNYAPSTFPYMNPFTAVKANMENEFDAEGTTKRSGNLAATITVQVVEVLPNGNLKIAGSREVLINNERQYITLSGKVRSRDISWNNSILSTYIADAQISYSGIGVINDRQRPGWAMRIFDWIWPF